MSELPSGIAAVGAYVPDLRVSAEELAEGWGEFQARGISEKAIPDADEDAVTMAYEAATRALDAGGFDGAEIDELLFASTNVPMAEEDLTSHLGTMLAVPESASRANITASTAAGMQALASGIRSAGRTLVVASDCPQGEPEEELEHAAGAGAAAFVLEPDATLSVTDIAESASPYPGTRFRQQGSETLDSLDVTTYERASFADVLSSAAEDLEYDPDDVDGAAVHAPDGATPYRGAGALGVDRSVIGSATIADEIGDAGAASVPLALAAAIEDGLETLLAAGYGSGATATLAHFEQTDGGTVPASLALEGEQSLSFAEYIRRRGDVTSGSPEGGGGYVSIPTWNRSIAQRYRLVAGRCPNCETLNFPPSGACSSCRELVEYDHLELSRNGTVEALSVIAQGGAPPEFAELQAKYGGAYTTVIVGFEGPDGESASAPVLVVGAENEGLTVGDPVEATIRRIYTQEGVTRYGVKVRPAEDG
jgi:hydroxymethylglutaryl-CoA synthase